MRARARKLAHRGTARPNDIPDMQTNQRQPTPTPQDSLAGVADKYGLLTALDVSLRDRATNMVDEAMKASDPEAARIIASALDGICGPKIKTVVLEHLTESACRIRHTAIEMAYQNLVERVVAQLRDGQPIAL